MLTKGSTAVIHSEDSKLAASAAKLNSVRGTRGWLVHLGLVCFTSLRFCNVALAATAPPLGSTSEFAVVSSTFTNSANPTAINGSVCYTTPPSTPPDTITGSVKTPCATNVEIADQGTALADLNSQLDACTPLGAAVDLSTVIVGGGTPGVIPPGCYSSTGAMSVGATLTLNGSGVYVFRPGANATTAALNTAANSSVTLGGGACAGNVFWAPTAATTLGANSAFVGTVIGNAGMTLGNGASLTGRALAAGGTVTTSANTITVPGACAIPALPTITVSNVSNGGVGTFGLSGSNGFADQSITTVAPGTGVTGATQTLAAAEVSTTVTATLPSGYSLTAISCSGLGAGGTQTSNLATRTVTLDAAATAAGSDIACTFTSTVSSAALPSVTVSKISNGGVETFSFSGTNGFANQSLTTLTSGSAMAGASQTLTSANVSTTITEAPAPAGYTLASIRCSGLGAGGAQTNDLQTRTVTLDAAATAAGSVIACTFTNNLAGFVPPATAIPTLSEWAMVLLAGLLAFAGFAAMRRKAL